MIVEKVKEAEEERRRVKMTGLSKQGAQTRWEVPERKITQRELITTPENQFRFLVKAVYDLLPTPQNKKTWFGEEGSCCLCGELGTLNHILSGCKVALSQGRYRWRHDQVLRELAHSVELKRKESNGNKKDRERRNIMFIKPGEKAQKRNQQLTHSYLDEASDWTLTTDLDGKLRVPREVADTQLRPDMILISRKTKRIGIVELTVPGEERIEVSGELKRAKYAPLEVEGRRNGWAVRVWTVEVGCRGFPATSMAGFLKDMGVRGGDRARTLKRIAAEAERCSRAIWLWSKKQTWGQYGS